MREVKFARSFVRKNGRSVVWSVVHSTGQPAVRSSVHFFTSFKDISRKRVIKHSPEENCMKY